jgi:hypothetical protein
MSEEEQQPVEVEVREWNTGSFTLEEGREIAQLKRLLKEQKIIRLLILKYNGRVVRERRNVRLKAKRDFFHTSKVETAYGNLTYQGTTFEYEGLD